jgi:hypothetical protein
MSLSVYTELTELNNYTLYPVLQFNLCLTTECSETTAHCNGNFDTDNQFYVS